MLVMATSLATSLVLAQPSKLSRTAIGQTSQASAEQHFGKAREYYANGRYREAIEQLEIALRIDPKGAELLYNLGVIHEKLQELDPAIDYYKRYVLMVGDPEEQQRVKTIIARLEKARDELGNDKEQPEFAEEKPIPVKEPERTKGRFDGWVIGTGILAAVGVAGGTYFGLEALKSRNEDPPTTGKGTSYADLEDNADRAKQMALFADIGFGVGVVAGTAAMLLYFMRDGEPEQAAVGAWEPGVAVVPGGMAASMKLGF